jgi:hypothetical protein
VTDPEPPPAPTPVRFDFEINENAHSCLPFLRAGTPAIGLWMLCALGSLRTDRPGLITEELARRYPDGERWHASIQRLIDAGMWKPVGDGWEMVPVPIPFDPLFRFRPVYHRDPIPEHLRTAVMERDGYACVQCGATEDLTLDHIHPWSLGGPDTYSNLRVLCRSCNSSKGARV